MDRLLFRLSIQDAQLDHRLLRARSPINANPPLHLCSTSERVVSTVSSARPTKLQGTDAPLSTADRLMPSDRGNTRRYDQVRPMYVNSEISKIKPISLPSSVSTRTKLPSCSCQLMASPKSQGSLTAIRIGISFMTKTLRHAVFSLECPQLPIFRGHHQGD
jgi:hypothetical protein